MSRSNTSSPIHSSACAKARAKIAASIAGTSGIFSVSRIIPNGLNCRNRSRSSARASTGSVSGKNIATKPAVTNDNPAAAHTGVINPNSASIELIAGPSVNPSPNAAPTIPYAFARSFGGVMSARYACAVEIFPPVAPAKIRLRYNTGNDPASANTTYPTAEPSTLINSTGRRPTRSEIAPRHGVARNCAAE